MTAKMKFLAGDATCPVGAGNKIIAHVCNDVGRWGKGFVLAVSKRWPITEIKYRRLAGYQLSIKLGTVQLIQVEKSIWVANMIAQHDIVSRDGVPPIRYEALYECLKELGFHAHQLNAAIHMPRIGCGLAGGEWKQVEKLIHDALPLTEVVVYSLHQS